MTTYTCSKCGESDLGMYGHHDHETDGFTCDKKKAEPPSPIAGIDDSELASLRTEVAKLRKENEALKGIERQRWENVNKTFGTAYSTEQANKLMNLPMNINDFGTHRPGDF